MAYIKGTPKYEVIYGTSKNDTIDGMPFNDLIYDTYKSDDTYIFKYGYYQPTFTDSGGNDTIIFGPGIKASDIKFYLTAGGYLMPRIKDTNDKPEIAHWPDSRYKIENWVFEDGNNLTSKDIDRLIDYNTKVRVYSTGKDNVTIGNGNNLVYLMQGSDTITTTGGNNIIEASSGNDMIINKYTRGNDEIYMGTDKDYTEDWGGNDRYIFNRGDGQDTIWDKAGNDTVKFGMGISKSSVSFSSSGKDLVVKFSGSSDRLIIDNWFNGSNNKIETFEFWDKSTITSKQIDQKFTSTASTMSLKAVSSDSEASIANDDLIAVTPTIKGSDGSDYSGGNYGDDAYLLGKGNDKIMDYAGNDTYLFNHGDGQDIINDKQGDDHIIFGFDIHKEDLIFSQVGNNLIININDTNDSINITDWFKSAGQQIEDIQFADGSHYTNVDINNIIHDSQVAA